MTEAISSALNFMDAFSIIVDEVLQLVGDRAVVDGNRRMRSDGPPMRFGSVAAWTAGSPPAGAQTLRHTLERRRVQRRGGPEFTGMRFRSLS